MFSTIQRFSRVAFLSAGLLLTATSCEDFLEVDSRSRIRPDDYYSTAGQAQAAALWKLRESIAEAERLQGPSVKHDVSVPVSAMPAFIEQARAAVEARFEGARVVAFGHLGDGNVHFNVQPPAGVSAEAWLARP